MCLAVFGSIDTYLQKRTPKRFKVQMVKFSFKKPYGFVLANSLSSFGNLCHQYLLLHWGDRDDLQGKFLMASRSGRVPWVRALVQTSTNTCAWTSLQVHRSKRLYFCTVSRCHTRGEFEDHTSEKACKKGSTLAFKPRTDVTKSPKQGYQWPHEKD